MCVVLFQIFSKSLYEYLVVSLVDGVDDHVTILLYVCPMLLFFV